MSGHLKATIALVLIGLTAILSVRFVAPIFQDAHQRRSSDAAATRGTLLIGADNWIGYFPLCSDEMKKRMRHQGFLLRCEDDQADYEKRLERLRGGRLQFAVATVDSYLLNGAAQGFPATVIAVIDESKGGDALVARKKKVSTLDDLKTESSLKVAFTPNSPSEYFLKSINAHFDLGLLKQDAEGWRVETNGSSAALEKLISGEADVAALWEPDVSRALARPDMVKLIGTEDTDKLIVDILLVNRSFSQEQPAAVAALLHGYFHTLKAYRDDPDRLRSDVIAKTGLGRGQVASMLNGVDWVGLNENVALWFGISPRGRGGQEGLVDAVRATVRVLMDSGDFQRNPLPDEDPYRITNSQFIGELYRAQSRVAASARWDALAPDDSLSRPFPPLDDAGWSRLAEVGTLEVRPIRFRRGTSQLTYEGKVELDRIVEGLRHYPNFRILINGHTGLRGDPRANRALSQERADAVARYLMVTYGVDENRLRAVGFGSTRPLRRRPDESDRAYAYRLPRVELSLASERF